VQSNALVPIYIDYPLIFWMADIEKARELVSEQVARGVPPEKIREAMANVGYTDEEIEQAMSIRTMATTDIEHLSALGHQTPKLSVAPDIRGASQEKASISNEGGNNRLKYTLILVVAMIAILVAIFLVTYGWESEGAQKKVGSSSIYAETNDYTHFKIGSSLGLNFSNGEGDGSDVICELDLNNSTLGWGTSMTWYISPSKKKIKWESTQILRQQSSFYSFFGNAILDNEGTTYSINSGDSAWTKVNASASSLTAHWDQMWAQYETASIADFTDELTRNIYGGEGTVNCKYVKEGIPESEFQLPAGAQIVEI